MWRMLLVCRIIWPYIYLLVNSSLDLQDLYKAAPISVKVSTLGWGSPVRMTGCWVELQLENTELAWPLSDIIS